MAVNNEMQMRGPKIDPRDYESVKCPKCGCEIFTQGIIIKKIPGVLVGAGTDDMEYPIPVMVCSKCGTLSPADAKALEKNTAEKKPQSGNLII